MSATTAEGWSPLSGGGRGGAGKKGRGRGGTRREGRRGGEQETINSKNCCNFYKNRAHVRNYDLRHDGIQDTELH